MSVASFAIDDLFVFRVIKSHTSNPDRKWANTYEFKALAGGDEGDLLAVGLTLVAFESGMAYPYVKFERLTISTWAPDSVPYDPESFISSALSDFGTYPGAGAAVALNQCLSVARVAAFGRFGHLFYRGFLDESSVSSPAGKSILADRAAVQASIDATIASSGLDDFLGAAPTGSMQMVMVNADGDQVRPILGLSAQGVSTVPMDHTWFNRTTITTP